MKTKKELVELFTSKVIEFYIQSKYDKKKKDYFIFVPEIKYHYTSGRIEDSKWGDVIHLYSEEKYDYVNVEEKGLGCYFNLLHKSIQIRIPFSQIKIVAIYSKDLYNQFHNK